MGISALRLTSALGCKAWVGLCTFFGKKFGVRYVILGLRP